MNGIDMFDVMSLLHFQKKETFSIMDWNFSSNWTSHLLLAIT